MILTIAAITFDLDAHITIDAIQRSDYGDLVRRATRSKTLDGGVSVSDFGFSHADRDFSLTFTPTQAEDETLRYIVEYHPQVHVSIGEGVFTAIPSYSMQDGDATIGLEVTDKITS
jgi:hypothetical protein